MNETPFQQRVIEEVRKRIGSKPWFRGVCMDKLKDIEGMSFEDAVSTINADTQMWDNIDFVKDMTSHG